MCDIFSEHTHLILRVVVCDDFFQARLVYDNMKELRDNNKELRNKIEHIENSIAVASSARASVVQDLNKRVDKLSIVHDLTKRIDKLSTAHSETKSNTEFTRDKLQQYYDEIMYASFFTLGNLKNTIH